MPVSGLLIPTIALICGYVLIRYTDPVTTFLNRVGGLVIFPRKVHCWIFRVCGAMMVVGGLIEVGRVLWSLYLIHRN